MGASLRRRALRYQLGASRKAIGIRWMNGWTVGVHLSKTKADDGAERSCLTRRRRRGQRVGKTRSRGGKPRSNVPSRPPESKLSCPRRCNHSGRKFLWYERTANLVAGSPAAKRVVDNWPTVWKDVLRPGAPTPFHRSTTTPREVRMTRDWQLFERSASHLIAHAKQAGIPLKQFGEWSPLELLKTRSPKGGDFDDFLAHLRIVALPKQEPPPDSKIVRTKGGVICRTCGNYMQLYELHGAGICRGGRPPKGGGKRGGGKRPAGRVGRSRGVY